MRLLIVLTAAAACGGMGSFAFAGELADACVERLEADGRDTSGCACLEKAVQGDADLIDELTALGEIDDPQDRYDAASDEAKAAMDKCTR